MASFSDTVRVVGSYTLSKIIPLQASYLGRSNASWARAQLARLRKLGTPEDRTWFSVGADVFGEWPEDKLGVPDESSATFKAVQRGPTALCPAPAVARPPYGAGLR